MDCVQTHHIRGVLFHPPIDAYSHSPADQSSLGTTPQRALPWMSRNVLTLSVNVCGSEQFSATMLIGAPPLRPKLF
jgi:hypothetical protein